MVDDSPSMDDRELADLLEQFGLSEKVVDTYLTLLELGEAKASQIADAAGVSKRYVYSVSKELESRGFVEVNDHVVPTTIRPLPPMEVIESLSESVESMRPALEERYTATARDQERFEVIKSRVTVLKRIGELVGRAESEITLSLPYDVLDEVEDELRAARERGVLVSLVVSGVEPHDDLALDGVASLVRVWHELMPTMLTVDSRTGLISPGEMVARSNSESQAIVFAQPHLGPVIVGSFFGNYWPMAAEAYTTDPDPLPATYHNFRHAVLQAALCERAGIDLDVTVTGRMVHTDGPTELHGRVVDIRQGLLEPANNSFPVENAFVVETDEGTYSIGGQGAFVEDFEADAVEFTAAE
ncbi:MULTISPECIES: TrmB family transcriptional regulator sugar-binding domain-containing protein [unclassified Haloferax]|uniref:TrmB family transcriptional regulator n=1 Tax=Haloferax TaxID=2251 RepID=UPI0002AF8329|nr:MULTISPECIES: TrmB family transcriptional regulator sugar-binding domain-containing protein [unclassified Haloferax]ELZ63087.1 transcriptional regulator [Haloferax sp. ATCC BAA-644]